MIDPKELCTARPLPVALCDCHFLVVAGDEFSKELHARLPPQPSDIRGRRLGGVSRPADRGCVTGPGRRDRAACTTCSARGGCPVTPVGPRWGRGAVRIPTPQPQ